MTTKTIQSVTKTTMAFPKHVQDRMGAATSAAQEQAKPTVNPAFAARIAQRTQKDVQAKQGHAPATPVEPPPQQMQQAQPRQEVSAGMRRVEDPPIVPNADPHGLVADLPSRYAFYDFKDILIGNLKATFQAKMAQAHASKSLAPMVEVISACLSTSHPDYQGVPLGFELTHADFYWVMYFLRINHYRKAVFNHSANCPSLAHRTDVAAGKKSPDSLRVTERVTHSNLRTTMLDEVPDHSDTLLPPELFLYPATMGDICQITENENVTNQEWLFLAKKAAFIRATAAPRSLTLEQRINIVSQLDPDQIQEIADFEKAMHAYGIKESITLNCRECGHSWTAKVSINAHSFLPSE